MTSLSTFWSRLRPWVWPSSEDLNPPMRDINETRIDSLNERVRQIEANERVDWTKIDAYYVRMASQSFMEHMNRVEVNLQANLGDHRTENAESLEALNSRLASAETLCGAEIAKLQAECSANSERLAKLLQQLKFIGGGA